MSTYVVVPVKKLSEAKSRLSAILSPRERAKLLLAMLEDVLGAVASSVGAGSVVVISRDGFVKDFASSHGVVVLDERGCGLNEAIEQATRWCAAEGARATLVLPADVPLISAADVSALCKILLSHDVVVVPSSDGEGTNALGTKPPGAIPPRFGPQSFSSHVAEAEARALKVAIVRNERLALDVDEPEDLAELLKKNVSCKTVELVKSLPSLRGRLI